MRQRKKSVAAAKESARKDIADAEAKAARAKTPAAKAVTREVADAKRRTYSGDAARETSRRIQAGDHPTAAAAASRKGARTARKAR